MEFDTIPKPPFEPIAELDGRTEWGDGKENLENYIKEAVNSAWLPPDDPRAPHILGEHDGYQIVRFNYHKSSDGEFEQSPRAVLATAIFYGEQPDHQGQGDDDYLHGVQLSIDENGQPVIPDEINDDTAKNFARNSIWGLAQGGLIDAKTGKILPADQLPDA
jgi:hypothetical protein